MRTDVFGEDKVTQFHFWHDTNMSLSTWALGSSVWEAFGSLLLLLLLGCIKAKGLDLWPGANKEKWRRQIVERESCWRRWRLTARGWPGQAGATSTRGHLGEVTVNSVLSGSFSICIKKIRQKTCHVVRGCLDPEHGEWVRLGRNPLSALEVFADQGASGLHSASWLRALVFQLSHLPPPPLSSDSCDSDLSLRLSK